MARSSKVADAVEQVLILEISTAHLETQAQRKTDALLRAGYKLLNEEIIEGADPQTGEYRCYCQLTIYGRPLETL